MKNTLRFWGVRGSLPSPGAATAGVGGNTSCVEIDLGGQRIIIDGGSGLRAFAAAGGGAPIEAMILFSHVHWDHIQGIPFFSPLYHPGSRVTMVGPAGLREALIMQMSRPTFPVTMDEVFAAEIDFQVVAPGDSFEIGDVEVMAAELTHPGGALGYRVRCDGGGVAYLSDHEQGDDLWSNGLLELVEGADTLICDAQYLPEEYPSKVGWGHGTYVELCQLAQLARARRLFLTHHDPLRSDAEVEQIEERARDLFPGALAAREAGPIEATAARSSCRGSASPAHRPSPAPQSSR